MFVPGLQPHIAYEETFEPRLVNRKTGGALLLTPAEATTLKAWDGSVSATRLSVAVSMHGLELEAWALEQLFHRFERLGCLAVPAPNIPGFVGPRPGVSKPEDKVPRLRDDLVITRAPRSRAVFHVKDPKTGHAFHLFDTEVSVARMLDGRRAVKELIENAAKLGIAVSIDGLQHFLKQLKCYGFIDPDAKDGPSAWPRRTPWTEEERNLYQASMKMLREGKYAEAMSFAQSLAAVDPTKDEVKQLRHRVEVEAEGIFELVCSFEQLHGPPPVVAPPEPPRAPPPPPQPKAPSAWERARERLRGRERVVFAGVAAVLGLGALLRPTPVKKTLACELQVVTLGVPSTTQGGKVGALDVELGQRVQKGTVVARLGKGASVEPLEARERELEAALKALGPEVASEEVRTLRVRLQALEAEVKKLAAAKKKKPAELAQRQASLEQLRAVLEERTHAARRKALTTELEQLRKQKAKLDATLARSLIVAPVPGVFVSAGALPEELGVNGGFGLVVEPNFKLVTSEPVPEGVEAAVFRAGEYEVQPALVGGQLVFPVRQAFVGAKGTLELSLGRAPWVVAALRGS